MSPVSLLILAVAMRPAFTSEMNSLYLMSSPPDFDSSDGSNRVAPSSPTRTHTVHFGQPPGRPGPPWRPAGRRPPLFGGGGGGNWLMASHAIGLVPLRDLLAARRRGAGSPLGSGGRRYPPRHGAPVRPSGLQPDRGGVAHLRLRRAPGVFRLPGGAR